MACVKIGASTQTCFFPTGADGQRLTGVGEKSHDCKLNTP